MPMIECHDCKAAISSEANTCPHCGCPVARWRLSTIVTLAVIFILFVPFAVTVGKATWLVFWRQ
jgi:hypothetical protein